MATKAEVKNETLYLLGLLAVGDTAAAADDTYMDTKWDVVFDDLKDEGLDGWPTAGPVPDKCVDHVAALMALSAMDTYSVDQVRYQRIVNKAQVAKIEIRRLLTPRHESLDEPVDY